MIYLFDQNENYIEVIEKDKVREASMTENVDSPNIIHLTLAVRSFPADAVYLAHKTLNVQNEIELYRIVSINNNNGFVDIQGIQSAYDDLSADGYVADLRPRNQPVRTVVSSILNGSRWAVGDVYTSGTVTTSLYQLSRLEALQKVLALGFEVKFRIGYRDGKITSRVIDIYSQIGESRDLRYEYGDNLLEIVQEDNRRTIYTAVVGRGRGEEKFDENGELTGFGRRISFSDVEWSVADGDPVDKPLGSEMVELPNVTAQFGYPDGKPRVLLSVFEDVEDPEELLRRSYNQLLASSRPKVTFKTKVRDEGRSGLGDTVQVVRDDLGIRYETRIFEREINLLDPKQVEIKFGDQITQWQTQRIRELKQRLENVSENTINNLQQVEQMIEFATRDFWGEHGYNYDLEADNEYNLPAGLYSFDRPIDQDPTKWVYLGAGKIVVSNSKRADGTWILSTILDGDGLGTDVVGAKQVQTGSLRTDHILLESGQTLTTGLATFADTLATHTTELTSQGLKITSHEQRLESAEADIANAQADADYAVTKYTQIESGEIILGQVEDLHDRVDNTEASIAMVEGDLVTKVEDNTLKETKEAIELVLEGKANASELEGLTPGWVEQVNSIDQFKLDYTELETRVENGEEINQLVTRSMTWDEGWLSIGADNSSTQVQITDDRINFRDGGEVVAYITGQTLYINTAMILSALQAGNHVTSAYGTNGEITVERWNG